MKKLQYSIEIQASPEYVHSAMLGLNDKKSYEEWTAAFHPSSSWEGSWDKGSKIVFVGPSENGKRNGMIARIAENIPGKFVSIQHYGVLENDVEITEGPKVDGWANAMEDYHFERTENGTRLNVEVDTQEEYIEYFDDAWPKALESLKRLCEKSA